MGFHRKYLKVTLSMYLLAYSDENKPLDEGEAADRLKRLLVAASDKRALFALHKIQLVSYYTRTFSVDEAVGRCRVSEPPTHLPALESKRNTLTNSIHLQGHLRR